MVNRISTVTKAIQKSIKVFFNKCFLKNWEHKRNKIRTLLSHNTQKFLTTDKRPKCKSIPYSLSLISIAVITPQIAAIQSWPPELQDYHSSLDCRIPGIFIFFLTLPPQHLSLITAPLSLASVLTFQKTVLRPNYFAVLSSDAFSVFP
jgi:hypothetical protein